ncbi:MAG: MBOAT family protein, partial [Gemmataceae bacterium]
PARARRGLLVLALFINLGMLAFFKYAGFCVEQLNALLTACGLEPLYLRTPHLPIGISFFTFQALSYVIDVYRGVVTPQRNPLHFGLYLSLFPQLIAGPIVRYRDVAAQIAARVVTREGFALGVQRFIIGLGKKMLLANTLAAAADRAFATPPGDLSLAAAWLGLFCYSLQIYFDFSGYSDMAIGLGKMFGFDFLENFNYSYVARSITEFWRRWHLSLSSWFRDYLYVPLGGNRQGTRRTYANLMIVFLLCGLWHGASWTFVAWGAYHGLFLVLERLGLGRRLEQVGLPVQHAYTLLVVMAGWVLFRADTLALAMSYFEALLGLGAGGLWSPLVLEHCTLETLLVLLIAVPGATPVLPTLRAWAARHFESWREQERLAWPLEIAYHGLGTLGLGTVFALSACSLAGGTYNPFIYFRF